MLNGNNKKERMGGKAERLVLWGGGGQITQVTTCNCIGRKEGRKEGKISWRECDIPGLNTHLVRSWILTMMMLFSIQKSKN